MVSVSENLVCTSTSRRFRLRWKDNMGGEGKRLDSSGSRSIICQCWRSVFCRLGSEEW